MVLGFLVQGKKRGGVCNREVQAVRLLTVRCGHARESVL